MAGSHRSRLQTQSGPPDGQKGEDHGGSEVPGELVVSGRNPSPVLEAGEGPFDDVSAFVGLLVERVETFPGWVLLDDRRCFPAFQERSERIAVEGGIRQQRASRRQRREQIRGRTNIAALARSDG